MEEKKLSEELRGCIDGKCWNCEFWGNEMVHSCICLLQKVHERIKDYEEMEEQGRLLKLPCMIGDKVYTVHTIKRKGEIRKEIWENTVTSFHVELDCDWNISFEHIEPNGLICPNYCEFKDIGNLVFYTRQEAEQALKEMEGKK